jgi:hypothetical protein
MGLGYHEQFLVGWYWSRWNSDFAVYFLFRQRWRMAISAEAMMTSLLFKQVYFQLFTWVVHG